MPNHNYSSIFQVARKPGLGKTSFVEHRTFFHLYHSFLRVWILLVLMLQVSVVIHAMKTFRLCLLLENI